jgi:hypothetical protein
VIDMSTDRLLATVDRDHTFAVSLEPHQGMSLLTIPADTRRGAYGRLMQQTAGTG